MNTLSIKKLIIVYKVVLKGIIIIYRVLIMFVNNKIKKIIKF